ncbi:MAG: hypothetical protein WBG71_02990 [Leeuwenhoekiella sp.]
MKHLIVWMMVFGFSVGTFAQKTKQERERGIDQNEMPPAALQFLEEMPFTPKRQKFYLEQDGDSRSYESKFKHNKTKYSVEFNPEGQLEDIEVIVEDDFLGDAVFGKIETYLENNFARHKTEKIQAQYLPPDQTAAFDLKIPNNYEMIVATKNDKNKLQKFEMTFNAQGNFISSRKIERRSYDFLLF